MNRSPIVLLLVLFCWVVCCCSGCRDNNNQQADSQPASPPPVPLIPYIQKDFYLHDTTSFTEGFLFHDGQLYEATGHTDQLPSSRSVFGVVDMATGKIRVKVEKAAYFGEGIAFLRNRVYQLTYQTHIGFVYDATTFKQVDTFHFANKEGWGLTTDGHQLIMSDGTDQLTFVDPAGFKPVRALKVTQNGLPRDSLNELEYIRGFIYANIWYNDHVVKIDPASGKVVGQLDLSPLTFQAKLKNPYADALNGIAYDSTADKVYVTGKLWSNIYEIVFPH